VTHNHQLPITNYLDWAAGKTLAIEFGSPGDAIARQWARRVAGLTLAPMPTAADALAQAEAGQANAALVDVVSAYAFVHDHPTLTVAGPPLNPEPYTIAVSLQHPRLFRELESALQALEADGTLPELRAKWFGVNP
jgi:polar amino acid transport system substrate-binding protein